MKHRYLSHVLVLMWVVSALASETAVGRSRNCTQLPIVGLSTLYVGNAVVAGLRRADPLPACSRSSEGQVQDVFIKGLHRQGSRLPS